MGSVLVVDDDEDGRELLAAYLRKSGLVTQTARHGKEALRLVIDQTPDVIVLDLMMPEMSGIEFMQVLRAYLKWASLPVIVVTAYPHGAHIERAHDLGMACLYEKAHFRLDDLRRCIERLMADPTGDCAAG